MSLGAAQGLVPGFTWEPGRNAGYRAGTNRLEASIAHATAGACGGDRSVGLRGYFNGYAPKSAACGPGATMFAELDATCFGACEFNSRATHLEVEKRGMDERCTEYQITKSAAWVKRCADLGIPAKYTDTPDARIPVGGPISGHVSHRSLQHKQCDQHYDMSWHQDEWLQILRLAIGLPNDPEVAMEILAQCITPDGALHVFGVGDLNGFGAGQVYENVRRVAQPGNDSSTAWRGWASIGGGRLYAVPTVQVLGDTITVVGQGDGRAMYINEYNAYKPGAWSGWYALGGRISAVKGL
jgi:hypothetical protein